MQRSNTHQALNRPYLVQRNGSHVGVTHKKLVQELRTLYWSHSNQICYGHYKTHFTGKQSNSYLSCRHATIHLHTKCHVISYNDITFIWSFVKIGHLFPKLERADKHRHVPKQQGRVKELFVLLTSGQRVLQRENKREGTERRKLSKDMTHNIQGVTGGTDQTSGGCSLC